MAIKVNNLYQHADGDLYCLLTDDAALKEPTPVGVWHDAVIYTGVDGKLRATSRARWAERFSPVAEYTGGDEQVLQMIRRTNPGSTDFDFVKVFEAWHESEMGITGHMLELAVVATLDKMFEGGIGETGPAEVTIMTEDLQRVVQTYEVERVPIPHGFTFRITKA